MTQTRTAKRSINASSSEKFTQPERDLAGPLD